MRQSNLIIMSEIDTLKRNLTKRLRGVFEQCYADVENWSDLDRDWLDVDLNMFDEDPASYFDQVKDEFNEFNLEFSDYPTNREIIDLIVERAQGR